MSAPINIVIVGPDIEEEYHLSEREAELLRSFINEPSKWQVKSVAEKARDVLRLPDKKVNRRSPGNNSK